MKYRFLDEDGRASRQSVADALEVLSTLPDFKQSFRGVIRIWPLFGTVGLVHIEWALEPNVAFAVGLCSGVGFGGTLRRPANQLMQFDLMALDGALVTHEGAIALPDGTEVIGVEVVPAHLPLPLTDTEYRILWHLMTWAGREKDCIRSLRTGLPIDVQKDKKIPDVRWFDFAKLQEITPPPLKVFAAHIEQSSDLRPSLQKISDTLQRSGIREPRARPRHSRLYSA